MQEPQWLTVDEAAAFCEHAPKYIENRTTPNAKRPLQSKIENGIKYVLVSEADKRQRASAKEESYAKLREECTQLTHTIKELRDQLTLKDTVIQTHAQAMAELKAFYEDKYARLNHELGTRGEALKRINEKKGKNVIARLLRAINDEFYINGV